MGWAGWVWDGGRVRDGARAGLDWDGLCWIALGLG